MTNLKNINNVFLIGIGGIGMSALARYFCEKGCHVSGYDRVPSPLTRRMEEEGIGIYYDDHIKNLDRQAQLVIYTPAIAKDNNIYQYYTGHGFPVYKRSEVLQMILTDMQCIAVAGTHGKTTISCMIAHILRDSGYGCYAFLGGIAANYHTNYWSNERPLAVVEADEYDRSFLRLLPDRAVLSALDADHLDIYGTEEKLQEAFIEFTRKIKPEGLLVHKKGVKRNEGFEGGRKWSYHLTDREAKVYAKNICINDGRYQFDVVLRDAVVMENMQLNVGGRYNIENALAAVSVCYDTGVIPERIRTSLSSFKGVKRRFEYVIREEGQVYIDDYAHHPEELRMLLLSVKELFPEDHCTILFQPHLYSRTRDLAVEFAKALDLADEVILLPVYPAREAPIPGIDSGLIAASLAADKVQVCSREEALGILNKKHRKIVVTAGAGDIGSMVNEVKARLQGDAQTNYKEKHVS